MAAPVVDSQPNSSIQTAAERLTAASTRPCAPVRDLLGTTDIGAAYAVQQLLTDQRLAAGGTVTGRKIGLTSPAVQQQLGVDQPDFGVLFADMDVTALPEVPSARLLQPKAEAEIAFVLGADLIDGDLDDAQIRAAVARAAAALEIVDSRIADWDITITDTVADNGSSGLYVLGDNWLTLDEFEPRDVVMQLYSGDELVSEGTGAACLGDPLAALAWLARTAREYGQPLRAGQVILSGALGPMVPTPPGTTVRAELSTLGTVTATFSKDTHS
ncbi:fumarylacetoacetate hydrolase family protein [Rhodococcus pseudokoreensis]|uniref:Fumarylacetoacetate hydrolase family protein n=1 Tax=Rhodococcus pseudokoreensis TaxID=2811421 RepID=A0A974W645_9NOCA|nr:fumarylacetoacetate hydrolase family protein [Rhodococcus pseudokoreensis]QSE91741.1 fumarylacetoacetate hydrolase family protein [Rhodococcus pseudokoreensis]